MYKKFQPHKTFKNIVYSVVACNGVTRVKVWPIMFLQDGYFLSFVDNARLNMNDICDQTTVYPKATKRSIPFATLHSLNGSAVITAAAETVTRQSNSHHFHLQISFNHFKDGTGFVIRHIFKRTKQNVSSTLDIFQIDSNLITLS